MPHIRFVDHRWLGRLAIAACVVAPAVLVIAATRPHEGARPPIPMVRPPVDAGESMAVDSPPPAASHGNAANEVVPPVGRGDRLAVTNVTYQGWKMFEVNCTRCHGEDAVGSSFAPALVHSVGPEGSIDHKSFWLTVTYGRPSKGMPTWANQLSPEQKEDIWNYLRARAVGGMAGGRPHLIPGARKDSTAFPPTQGDDTTFVPPFLKE